MLTAQNDTEQTVRQSQDPRIVGYPSRLNLYHFPPPYEIKIEQFELFALDRHDLTLINNRLTVLKAIETAMIRNSLKSKEAGYNPNVLNILKDKLGLGRNSLLKTVNQDARRKLRKAQFEERKKDHVSHFIMQLAFCQSVDLRAWFTKFETELFRIRLSEEDSESIHQLIEQADFGMYSFLTSRRTSHESRNVQTPGRKRSQGFPRVPFKRPTTPLQPIRTRTRQTVLLQGPV
jgi:DNA primase large subunit